MKHNKRMPMRRATLALSFALTAASSNVYPFNYSNTHGPSMVLQRGGAGALVWGFGTAFAPVSLSLLCNSSGVNVTLPGLVDSEGIWRVRLPPQPASAPGDACSLAGVAPTTTESFTLTDILFGDVVLCGGVRASAGCARAKPGALRVRMSCC